jgi:chromosome segregation ATPase
MSQSYRERAEALKTSPGYNLKGNAVELAAEADAEIAALKAERDAAKTHAENMYQGGLALLAELESLKAEIAKIKQAEANSEAAWHALIAELEALKPVADRYRWVKENADVIFNEPRWFFSYSGQPIQSTRPSKAELDDAIDAQIRENKYGW